MSLSHWVGFRLDLRNVVWVGHDEQLMKHERNRQEEIIPGNTTTLRSWDKVVGISRCGWKRRQEANRRGNRREMQTVHETLSRPLLNHVLESARKIVHIDHRERCVPCVKDRRSLSQRPACFRTDAPRNAITARKMWSYLRYVSATQSGTQNVYKSANLLHYLLPKRSVPKYRKTNIGKASTAVFQ